MNIRVIRIDDRLVHGQIISRWLQYADNATRIFVVDDKAAGNPMLATILKIAVPHGVEFVLKTSKDAIEYIQSDTSNKNTLLLVRNPEEMYRLLELGLVVEEVNLGNISHTRSELERRKILDYIYVTEEDEYFLNKILEHGVRLDVRAVPEEKSKNIESLLKNT